MIKELKKLGLPDGDLAPVIDGAGKCCFEIYPCDERIDWVPVKKSLAVKVGALRCPLCNYLSFGFVHNTNKEIRQFIAGNEWPASELDVRLVGRQKPAPVMTSKARSIISGNNDLQGFGWGLVGRADDSDIERNLKYDRRPKKL